MAQDDRTLELVFIDIQARTKDLDEQLKRLVDRVEEQGRRAGTAFSAALGGALNTTTDAAREVTAATSAVAATVDNQLAPALNGAASAARDAALSQKDLDKALADIRERAQGVKAEYESGAIGLREFTEQSRALKVETVQLLKSQDDQGASLKRIADELRATDDLTKEYGVAVRNVRSAFISGRIGAEEFATTSRRLKDEIDELFKSTDLTAQQQLRLNIASATAERGLASLDGRASRLGLAWNVQIGLANQFGQSLRGLGPLGQAAAGGLGIIQNGLGNLNQPLDLARLRFDGFLASAARAPQVLALAGAAFTTLALVGLTRLATEAAKVADGIDKASISVGLGAEEFQEYEFALKQSGVRADSVRTALGNLNTRVGEAIEGNEKYRATLERLGVDLDAVRDGSQGVGDVLAQVADGISRLATPAQQAQAATELFGRGLGNQLLPALKLGSEGLAELRQQARDLGLVISGEAIISLVQYADEVEALKQQFQTARIEIAAAFLPVLRDLLIPLIQNSLVPLLQTAAQRVTDFATALTDAGPAGVAFRREIVETLGPVVTLGQALVTAGAAGLGGFLTLLGGAAQFGAYLGVLSTQVDAYITRLRDLAPLFTAVGRIGTNPIQAGLDIANAVRNLQPGAFDSPFDLGAASAAGRDAGQRYYEAALDAFDTAGSAFSFDLADFLETTTAGVRDAIERGVGTLGGLGEDAGTELGQGIKRGVERTLGSLLDDLAAAGTAANRIAAFEGTPEARLAAAEQRFRLIDTAIRDVLTDFANEVTDGQLADLRARRDAAFREISAIRLDLERQVTEAFDIVAIAPLDPVLTREELRRALDLTRLISGDDLGRLLFPPDENAALIASYREYGNLRRQAWAIETNRIAAEELAANQVIIDSVREANNLRRQAYTIAATAELDAARALRARIEELAASGGGFEATGVLGGPNAAAPAAGLNQIALLAQDTVRALLEANAPLREVNDAFERLTRVTASVPSDVRNAVEALRRDAAIQAFDEAPGINRGLLADLREETEAIIRVEAQLAQARQRAAVITGTALSPTQALVQELGAIIPPTEALREEIEALTQSLLDAEAAAAAAAASKAAKDAAKAAQAEFEQLAITAINAAGQAANGFVTAFRDFAAGNAGGGFGSLLGSAGAIAGLFNPIAGTILGVLGSLVGNLFGNQGRSQTDLERTRAGSNASRTAPAVQIAFTISEPRFMFDTDFGSPQTRQAMRAIFDDWMEEFVRRTGLANLLRDRLAFP